MRPPPEVFSLPVVRCPACSHGIDPHKGGRYYCMVGDENGVPCDCLWTPNDIAAQIMADLRAQVEALRAGAVWPVEADAFRAVLALIDGGSFSGVSTSTDTTTGLETLRAKVMEKRERWVDEDGDEAAGRRMTYNEVLALFDGISDD